MVGFQKGTTMNKFSVLSMKVIRKTISPISNWYRKTAFLSGLSSCGKGIAVRGPVYLWCDDVRIDSFTNVYPGVTLWGAGRISIGKHVELGINSVIYSSNRVEIKDNVLISAHCYIIDSNHGIEKDKLIREQTSISKGPVVIEEDAWLGAGVKVLSGVRIGKGAVIGAQSLVNKDIPDYAIAVGVPAKVIGYRK